MDVSRLMEMGRDQVTVGRVFGEPLDRDGVTVVPVATVMGGGGGGQGSDPSQQGEGGGFGLVARPAGVYVIAGGQVRWKPAVSVERVLATVAILVGSGAVVRLLAGRGRRD